jgi:hypothetical protein
VKTSGRVRLRRAVAAEARRLDDLMPGWANDIEPERLNMRLCADCVLGQLFDHYDAGFDELVATGGNGERMLLAFGCCDEFGPDPDWDEVQCLWLAEVAARVGGGAS